MTSRAIALPRARPKRRKPMPPWLKLYLAAVVADVIFLAYNVVQIGIDGPEPIAAALACMWSLGLWRDWPRFRTEWDRWRKDDA